MGRPRKQSDSPETRTLLLDVAGELFSQQRYDEVTLAAIGKAAGIRAPSILHHFASKADLYAAVVEAFYAELTTEMLANFRPELGSLDALVAALRHLEEMPAAKRDRLIAIVLEIVHSGRGAEQILDRLLAMIGIFDGQLGAEGREGLQARASVGLLGAAAMLNVQSERIPPPVQALIHAIWPQPVDLRALAKLLLLRD